MGAHSWTNEDDEGVGSEVKERENRFINANKGEGAVLRLESFDDNSVQKILYEEAFIM